MLKMLANCKKDNTESYNMTNEKKKSVDIVGAFLHSRNKTRGRLVLRQWTDMKNHNKIWEIKIKKYN